MVAMDGSAHTIIDGSISIPNHYINFCTNIMIIIIISLIVLSIYD